jgi:hypothetical protein
MLHAYVSGLDRPGGVYLTGDDFASYWAGSLHNTSPAMLRDDYLNFDLTYWSHRYFGLCVSPRVVGEPGSIFESGGLPDSLLTYGGCPWLKNFDVITALPPATLQATYKGGCTGAQGAIVAQKTTNPFGVDVGVVLSGFGFNSIRDAQPGGVPASAVHLERILGWLGNPVGPATGAKPAPRYANSLGQNYPNPFNPTTTITYSIATPGHVSLKIYNVAGQLVRTLVDETARAGMVHEVTWRGQNDAGSPVASGVYFYRLTAAEYVKTRKMVLLK